MQQLLNLFFRLLVAAAAAASAIATTAVVAATAVAAAVVAAKENEKRDNDNPDALVIKDVAQTVVHKNLQIMRTNPRFESCRWLALYYIL